MRKNLPLIELVVTDSDDETGMFANSFVKDPAVKRDW